MVEVRLSIELVYVILEVACAIISIEILKLDVL